MPWETFPTYGESTVYGEGPLAKLRQANEAVACCGPAPAVGEVQIRDPLDGRSVLPVGAVGELW